MDSNHERLNELRLISSTLDSKFKGPMGMRFGFDGLLGLIPVVGDVITSAFSLYIIAQAALMGVAPVTLLRMAINVGVESLVDLVPVVGNFFDFYWKANNRNMRLIENHFNNPVRETIKSRMVVGLLGLVILTLVILSGYVTFLTLVAIFRWLRGEAT